MLPPVGAEFIAGIRQTIASVPADEMVVAAGLAIWPQEAAACTG